MPMFRSTKTFEARQFTKESASDVARWCDGLLRVRRDHLELVVPFDDLYPWVGLGGWVVQERRFPGGVFRVLTDEEFVKAYEPEEQS